MPETTYIPLDGSGSRGSCLGNLSALEKILIILSATLGIFVIGLTIGLVNCNNSHNDDGNVTTIAPETTTATTTTTTTTTPLPTSTSPNSTTAATTTAAPSTTTGAPPNSSVSLEPTKIAQQSPSTPTSKLADVSSNEYLVPKLVEIPTSSPTEELDGAEKLSPTSTSTFLDRNEDTTDLKTSLDNVTINPRESQTEV